MDTVQYLVFGVFILIWSMISATGSGAEDSRKSPEIPEIFPAWKFLSVSTHDSRLVMGITH
jgi:hypothetical protein